jgi:hypothetical protein
MAKNTKFDCVENYVKKTAGTKFYEHADSVVMWRDNIKNYWQFFKDNQWIKVVNNLTMERGNWECDGADGFIIISRMGKTWKTSDPTWKDTPEATAEGNPIFNCIRNRWADDETVKFTEYPNKLTMIDSRAGGFRLVYYTNGRLAYFENNSDGKEEFITKGDWKCKGERDYEWTFDDERRNPTTEPEQTTEPEADDSFPLKEGSEGPNVVKLQKFLNDKIPSNPLTVNGKFDEKTKNKLIEYQKKEGII